MANIGGDTDLIISLRAEQGRLRQDLAKAKGQMQNFSKQSQTIAARIQTSLAVAFGGFAVIEGIRSTIGVMADFEMQMDKVQAISGASKEEVALLTKNARDLGAVSKFTATEIGQLQEELARLGFTTDQIVNMTDASRKLATVADTELGHAAKVVGQQIKAFGLEATDATRVANVMAESFTKSALDMEKFEVAMSFAGAAGKAFGQDIETTVSQVATLIDRGIQASKAGTALRTIFIELSKSGMTLEEAFAEINGSTNKLNTSAQLFGKTAANQGLILAENAAQTAKLNTELSDANMEMDKAVSIMEGNLLTDLAKLRSAFEELILGGSAFAGVLRDIVQDLTEAVGILNGSVKKDSFFEYFVALLTWDGLVGNPINILTDRIQANRAELRGWAKDFDKVNRAMWDGLLDKNLEKSAAAKNGIVDILFPNIDNASTPEKTNADGVSYSDWAKGNQEYRKQTAAAIAETAKMTDSAYALNGVYTDMGLIMDELWNPGEFSESELASFFDGMDAPLDELLDKIPKISQEFTDLEMAGVRAAQMLATEMFSGKDAAEAFANTIAATQQMVVSMLIERAAAYLLLNGTKEGLPGLLAAAAGLTILSAAMGNFKTKGSSAAPTSINPVNRGVSDYNNITGSLRIVTGANGLSGIIEAEGNRNGLRGG